MGFCFQIYIFVPKQCEFQLAKPALEIYAMVLFVKVIVPTVVVSFFLKCHNKGEIRKQI